MEYGHSTNEWFGKAVSRCHSSMQIDMKINLKYYLKCRELCKTDKIKLSCGYYRSHLPQHAAQQSAHQCSQVIFPNIEYRPLYLIFKMNAALSSLLTLFSSELVLRTHLDKAIAYCVSAYLSKLENRER